MRMTSSNPRNLRSDITFAFALAVACYLAWFVRDVLMLLYVSALFAVVLTPLVRFTSRIRIRNWRPFKGTAILVLLLVLVGAIVTFCYLALPPVIRDLQTFSQEAPARLPGILDKLKRIPFLGRLNDTAIQRQSSRTLPAMQLLICSRPSRIGSESYSTSSWDSSLRCTSFLEGDQANIAGFFFFPCPKTAIGSIRLCAGSGVPHGQMVSRDRRVSCSFSVSAASIVFLALHVRYAYAKAYIAGALEHHSRNRRCLHHRAGACSLPPSIPGEECWGIAIFYFIYLQVENAYLTPRIMRRSSVSLPGPRHPQHRCCSVLSSRAFPAPWYRFPPQCLVSVLVDEYLVYKERSLIRKPLGSSVGLCHPPSFAISLQCLAPMFRACKGVPDGASSARHPPLPRGLNRVFARKQRSIAFHGIAQLRS